MIKIETGSFIKLERKKRNMTQEELSEGIVSASYLSKIENNKAEVDSNTLKLLYNRLGIEINNDSNLDLEIEKKCKEWYDMLFDRYDKRIMTEKYEELQQLISTNINDQKLTFEIHKIRYYVVLRDFKKALQKINDLYDMVDLFNSTHKYYWNKFKGDYYSFKEDYQLAMRCYKTAEEKIRLANINEAEIADLHYAISTTYCNLLNGLETINYAKKAMTVFQQEYNFIRCAQCHILLGISYQQIKMYDIALKNFNKAMYLGKLENNEQVIQLAHLNLGLFYFTTGDSKKSIRNYLLALKTRDLDYELKLDAITHLIHSLYKSNDRQKAKEYLHLGEETLSLAQDKEYYKFYNYIIQVYTYLLNGDVKKFRSILAKKFIPYLTQKKAYKHLVFYARLLAVHLEKMGKYKESMCYYKIASKSYDKIIKL
ncbi:MAG: Transcriptional regulator [Virgibacillus proomii]